MLPLLQDRRVQIGIGAVALLLIIGSLITAGSMATSSTGVSEVTVLVEPTDGTGNQTITLDVPEKVSLTNQLLADLNLVPLAQTSAELSFSDTADVGEVNLRQSYRLVAIPKVQWTSKGVTKVDRIELDESGNLGGPDGPRLVGPNGNPTLEGVITRSSGDGYGLDGSAILKPDDEFVNSKSVLGVNQGLLGEDLDGTVIKGEVFVQGLDDGGRRVGSTATFTIKVTADPVLATISAEITDVTFGKYEVK